MKSFTLFLLVLASLAGCSSTKTTSNNEALSPNKVVLTALPCTFPDTPNTKAPIWVCETKIDGLVIQGMGVSENEAAGISHQRQLALLDGQTVLAEQLKSNITAAVKSLSATQGSKNELRIAKSSSSDLAMNIDNEIHAMTIYQSVRSPGGAYYVLVGLDKKSYTLNIKTKVQASINADGQLWQSATQGQSTEQLINDITEYIGQ